MRSVVPSLVKRDILSVLHTRGAVVPQAVMVAFSPFFSGNPFFSLLFCALPSLSWASLLFSFDEKYGVDRFTASLPVERKDAVIARYCTLTLVGLLCLAYVCTGNFLLSRFNPAVAAFTPVFPIFFLSFFTLSVGCMLPLYFKMGFARGRNFGLIFMMLPAALGGVFFGLGRFSSGAPGVTASMSAFFNSSMPASVLSAAAAACILALAGSVLLSVRLFAVKEL